MDVKFINPFINGAIEVMEKMAFTKPVPGKPYAKVTNMACGDISGIIGMTGDATGSLAISFSEKCILNIVTKMLGETYTELDRTVFDAVGELTNMISGSSRKQMEKDNLKVFAAIPTIVFGRQHTIYHVIKGPSIVLPFKTEAGEFVIDVCLKSNIKQKHEGLPPAQKAAFNTAVFEKPSPPSEAPMPKAALEPKAHHPAASGNLSAPKTEADILQEKIQKDLGKAVPLEHKNAAERIEYLRKVLIEVNTTRDLIMKQMKEQPFMEYAQRQRYKNALPAYDAKIRRLKLDISAAETILNMSRDELENPTIKPHFQHYPNKSGK
jgi:chemotaxis protein CheX